MDFRKWTFNQEIKCLFLKCFNFVVCICAYEIITEREREREMSRCYLTGAVGSACCLGSRYDSGFAYNLRANAVLFQYLSCLHLMVGYWSLVRGVGGSGMSTFHIVDVTWSHRHERRETWNNSDCRGLECENKSLTGCVVFSKLPFPNAFCCSWGGLYCTCKAFSFSCECMTHVNKIMQSRNVWMRQREPQDSFRLEALFCTLYAC